MTPVPVVVERNIKNVVENRNLMLSHRVIGII